MLVILVGHCRLQVIYVPGRNGTRTELPEEHLQRPMGNILKQETEWLSLCDPNQRDNMGALASLQWNGIGLVDSLL